MPERKVKDESFFSTKELAEFMNVKRIQKEDVINVSNVDGMWFLIYFG